MRRSHPKLVIEELAEIRQSDYNPEVIRRILEAHRPACGRKGRDTPACKLTRALSELEMVLDSMAAESN